MMGHACAHTRFSLPFTTVPAFPHPKERGAGKQLPPWVFQPEVGVSGEQSGAPWQAGARGDDEPAPRGRPEDFGSRLSQPCQPFKHPAHTH